MYIYKFDYLIIILVSIKIGFVALKINIFKKKK